MKITKSNPYLSIINDFLIDSSCPSNITYFWNFGSLLGVLLVVCIISGITLAMHYTNHVDFAFNSVEHIMRDVHNGWLIRNVHMNAVAFFFICVYIHIGRGLYFGSYRAPRTILWNIGVIIFLVMMGTAFIGTISSPTINLVYANFYFVKLYNELNSKETKSSIYLDNINKSGIYGI